MRAGLVTTEATQQRRSLWRGHVEAGQAELEGLLAYERESGVRGQAPHLPRGDAGHLALDHSAAHLLVVAEEEVRDASRERADHRGEEHAAGSHEAPQARGRGPRLRGV